MSLIEYLETSIVYENPKPHVHSRHGYFPGLVQLASGDLLALFVRAEAFESPDATTFVARSSDLGNTWTVQGPLYDKSIIGFQMSDSLKATVLRDGSLIAVGNRFHRHDPESGIGIEATGGILPGENVVSFSRDEGRTWTTPQIIPHSTAELSELSGPCLELGSGDLVAVAGLYKLPDGSNPSGQFGVLLRSRDKGRHWDDTTRFFQMPGNDITAWEPRICEMQPGRVVAIVWAYNIHRGQHLTNRVVVSHDNGHSWSDPIDTGHSGQASNLLWLKNDLLLSIHAHRGEDVGIYVRLIDFRGDQWRPIEEKLIWGKSIGRQTREGQDMVQMFQSIRFGQPSLLRLTNGEILATHWSVEEGQGKIRTHRLRLKD
jgi:sialidase-1